MINVMVAAVSLYMLCSDESGLVWNADNALVVLGFMFFIILAIVALFGALKEESYVIITYDLFILVIGIISCINSWRSLWEEILIMVFVSLSFLFAFLLYRKHPIPST
ncbi:hypothetical protein B4U80_08048 [Leptotrombidium deliense]|uniref:Uncharacterized protein n=1 Tax=Leptotrombidium deliense TaxID=299467 RepID=A0A443SGH5_9ACAR|nr:hypothetical protein B4U80_08048 [Leptotrombidium deliense]